MVAAAAVVVGRRQKGIRRSVLFKHRPMMQSVQIDAVLLVPADINNRLLIDADDVVIAMQAAAAATR